MRMCSFHKMKREKRRKGRWRKVLVFLTNYKQREQEIITQQFKVLKHASFLSLPLSSFFPPFILQIFFISLLLFTTFRVSSQPADCWRTPSPPETGRGHSPSAVMLAAQWLAPTDASPWAWLLPRCSLCWQCLVTIVSWKGTKPKWINKYMIDGEEGEINRKTSGKGERGKEIVCTRLVKMLNHAFELRHHILQRPNDPHFQ